MYHKPTINIGVDTNKHLHRKPTNGEAGKNASTGISTKTLLLRSMFQIYTMFFRFPLFYRNFAHYI